MTTKSDFLVQMEASRIIHDFFHPKSEFIKKVYYEFVEEHKHELIEVFELMINSEQFQA